MASISKASSGKWRARYRDGEGREHARHFAKKAVAEQWLVQQQAAMQRGDWVDPRDAAMSVRTYAETVWLPSLDVAAQTRREYTGTLERYLLPSLGARQLGKVGPADARRLVAELQQREKPLAGSTLARTMRTIRALFDAAVADRRLPRNPFSERLGTRPKATAREIPSLDDVMKLARACRARGDEQTRAMVLLAAATGLRVGEMRGLTVDRVDFLRGLATIDRAAVDLVGEKTVLAAPKTETGRRTVAVPRPVLEELSAFLAARPSESGWLFHDRGEPVPYSTLDYRLKLAGKTCGLPGIRWHLLRHHAASVMIAAGVPVPALTKVLGHSSPRITFQVYAHLLPDEQASVRDAMAAVWTPDRLKGLSPHSVRKTSDGDQRSPTPPNGITAGQTADGTRVVLTRSPPGTSIASSRARP